MQIMSVDSVAGMAPGVGPRDTGRLPERLRCAEKVTVLS